MSFCFLRFTLPFDLSHFEGENTLLDGILYYQEQIPCPSILAKNLVYRIYTSQKTEDYFEVDYIVVNHPLGYFVNNRYNKSRDILVFRQTTSSIYGSLKVHLFNKCTFFYL